MVEDLFGDLVVRSSVDRGGNAVTGLEFNSTDTDHKIEVENWAIVPYDVQVASSLPDFSRYLEFSPGRNTWDFTVHSLVANNGHDHRTRRLHASSGGGLVTDTERVHCVDVSFKHAGKNRWRPANGPYPLELVVTLD